MITFALGDPQPGDALPGGLLGVYGANAKVFIDGRAGASNARTGFLTIKGARNGSNNA
ncbi:MAG: hypothetical protein IH820_07405 [Bacteroidetes bacterium]|nr:hypothetical protein [Bacteroidota bacterium]